MRTILIVEDDELNMRMFNELLRSHGFNTIQSPDGMDTMRLARKHRPDLVVMDIQLPKVSGLEHVRMLKADEDLRHIPVLAVTALAMVGDKDRALEVGCDGYLTKPIDILEFLDEVRRFLKVGRFRLTDALHIGHPQIDAEHEQLVALVNEALDFIDAGDDKGCAEKIDQLSKAFKIHLRNEERIMEELGYGYVEEHKLEHLMAIGKFSLMLEDAERTGYGSGFANDLVSLFADFIVRVDLGLKKYLEDMNGRPSDP